MVVGTGVEVDGEEGEGEGEFNVWSALALELGEEMRGCGEVVTVERPAQLEHTGGECPVLSIF